MQDDAIQVITVQGSCPERFSQAVPPRVPFMAAIDTPLSLLVRLQGREKDDAWREFSVCLRTADSEMGREAYIEAGFH